MKAATIRVFRASQMKPATVKRYKRYTCLSTSIVKFHTKAKNHTDCGFHRIMYKFFYQKKFVH